MKTRLIAVALVSSLSSLVGMLGSGGAHATDGNTLLHNCQVMIQGLDTGKMLADIEMYNAGQCLGLVEGVKNTIYVLNSALPENYKVCFPKGGINNGQSVRIVEKYLRDYPEQLNEDQTMLTILAYKKAYPCK